MIRFCFFLFILSASGTANVSKKVSFKNTPPGRIINGETASLGQFPWQAALIVSGFRGEWFCGGSIISEEWILTAAHCVDGAFHASIYTGAVQRFAGNVSYSNHLIQHQHYDAFNLANDIGLIKLNTSLVFGENTKPIKLSTDILASGAAITVSGWGRTSDHGVVSNDLNYVDLVTISTSQCEYYYGVGEVFDGMVCASSPNSIVKSSCMGDSGGPVIVHVNNEPVHVATVSFVSDLGCESGNPSGYTRTEYYIDWIMEQTGL